jgi:uncharacterized membrane protein
MSGAWAIVPLLPLIVGIVATVLFFALLFSSLGTVPAGSTPTNSTVVAVLGTFFGALIFYYLAYFVVIFLVAFMIFKMVKRRNLHFNRQILLQEDLVAIAKEMASKKGVDVAVLINNMERSTREARLEDAEKNATLYAVIGFGAPIVWLYVAYFLMKDFFRHERREDLFINDTLRTFNALSMPINFPYRNPPIPDRSFALYFVLSLITASIFGVYWVYVLVTDPNNHFRQQMMIEDTIMAQLSGTNVSPSLPAPPPG